MSGPSLAELRATGQPPEIIGRLNDEHWAGRLYMRRVSPRATWVFARLGWSPNAVTVAFIVCGVAAGVVVAFGGLWSAIVAAILIQAYLLFDCSDGELARWSGRTSAPRSSGLALARRLAAALKLHRIIQAVELSLLILVAAIIDAIAGNLTATRVLLLACLVIAALMVVAHLAAIVTSRRLR